MGKRQRILFSDLTFGSKNVILEDAEITGELTEIAALRGIVLPTPDIKLFKTVFAMADEENLNGCTLPYDEVKNALATLVGKAVDLEHYRKETVGTWLDAKLEGNMIVAYGSLWVSNYEEEATEILEDFKSGSLTVSFEAWGIRENTGPFSYKLKDIHFCGGALLRHHTQPACPTAFVQEFSKKGTHVLEFANVIGGKEISEKEVKEEKDSYECECIVCGNALTSKSHCKDLKCKKCGGQMRRKDKPGKGQGEKEKVEQAILHLVPENIITLMEMLSDLTCPNCGINVWPELNVVKVDFEHQEIKSICDVCGTEIIIDYSLKIKEEIKNISPEEVDEALGKFLKEKKDKQRANKLKDSKKNEKEREVKMDEEMKKLEEKLAEIKVKNESLTEQEVKLTARVEELTTQVTEITEASETLKTEKAEVDAKLAEYVKVEEEAKKVEAENLLKARREELVADESVSDEDLLDDAKYEVMKLKKELSDANAEIEKTKKDLEVSGKKEVEDNSPEWHKTQKRVSERTKKMV